MARTSFSTQKVAERVNEKEKQLISALSDSISKEIGDLIEDSLQDKLDGFETSVGDASSQVDSMKESLRNLHSVMDSVKDFDIANELEELQAAQNSMKQSVAHADEVFSSCKHDHEVLLQNLNATQVQWQTLHSNLMQTVTEIQTNGSKIHEHSKVLQEKSQLMSNITTEFNTALAQLKEKADQLDNEQLSKQIDDLRKQNQVLSQNMQNLAEQVSENEKNRLISIMPILIGVIVMILQIVGFFIK